MKGNVIKIFLILLSLSWTAQGAIGVRGAAAVLKDIQEAALKTNQAPAESAYAKMAIEVDQLKDQVAKLNSKAAAARWAEVAIRYTETEPDESSLRQGRMVRAEQLIVALPSPNAWPELNALLQSRPIPAEGPNRIREMALHLLGATLSRDIGAQKSLLSEIENAAPVALAEKYISQSVQQVFNDLTFRTAADADQLLAALDRRIALMDPEHGDRELQVPDLVPWVGQQRAEIFFRRALTNRVALKLEHDGESTARVARKVATSMVAQMKVPQWALAQSITATELFEAMEKQFKSKDGDHDRVAGHDYEYDTARIYYLLSLIVNERLDDAIKVATQFRQERHDTLPMDALGALERAGHVEELAAFFQKLLATNPELPFWQTYFQLAAKSGQGEQMLAFARATVTKVQTAKVRARILEDFHLALLAADQLDEGVAELRKLLASTPRDSSSGGTEALRLIRLGQLLKNEEWVKDGMEFWRKLPSRSTSSWYGDTTLLQILKVMAQRNQGAEAEKMLVDVMVASAKEKPERFGYLGRAQPSGPLLALAFLYEQLGRHDDVITLLQEAPLWGKADLVGFLSEQRTGASMFTAGQLIYSVPMLAARALKAAGRRDQALQVVNAVLNTQPGDDAAYELLIELDKAGAPQILDELFARDMFEERPLIWKAQLLKDAGKLEEAEKMARQAISIDPSDGEQGPGRRMRVYAVLADIREARGDRKEAEFLRGAVRAVRTAEEADRFYEAGLLGRAVKMYKESLNFFTDAYCIQSRLAVQLAGLGRHAEAEEHYRRAYELMPDSFGRVESHCFGCEHVFEGERAQTLAEKVFSEFVAKNPQKPQVHYLLGTLRDQQERLTEALKHFERATLLDPQYLNAWAKLQAVGRRLGFPSEKRDAAALNILRLDPLQRHAFPDFEDILDLAALWSAVEQAEKLRPVIPTKLYPLPASAAVIEKAKQAQRSYIDHEQIYPARQLTPGAALARTAWLRAVSQLLDAAAQMNRLN